MQVFQSSLFNLTSTAMADIQGKHLRLIAYGTQKYLKPSCNTHI